MRKINLVAFLIGFTAITAFAQETSRCSYKLLHQTDNWFFRLNAGMQFNGELGNTTVTPNNLPSSAPNVPFANGTSVLSDETGKLILYSDGMKVWNAQNKDISNGLALGGDFGSLQSALIVPNPSIKQMVYIFTTGPVETHKGLMYSRVDMTSDAGNGQVMEAGNVLLGDAVPVICSVKSNDNDFWVLTRKLESTDFYAYKVDANGVNTNPVISSGGTPISSNVASREAAAIMKFAPKGDKVALCSYGKGTIEIFDFNDSNGTVSYNQTISVQLPTPVYGPYYIEFSPDGQKLYVTVLNAGTNVNVQNYLYQFDLANGGIETKLNPTPLKDDVFALQLGRDGKIYVTRKNKGVLGVIENPNRQGNACNYNESAFNLVESQGMLGLPNFVASFLNIPAVDYDTKCLGDGTVFTMQNTSNISTVDWDFGDPGSTDNIIIGGTVNPTHVFSKDSTFTVNYTEHFNGQSWTNSIDVTINPLPAESFAAIYPNDSTYIVNGSSILVYANPDMYSYYWQDGSTNISYNITQPGTYTVLVEDMNCCSIMDTLYVVPLDIKIPSAFSPDGDGLNETFSAIGPEVAIIDLSFSVFNKWGQMVWQTNNLADEWNGKIGSTPAPAGLYTWYLTLNVKGNQMNNGKVKLTGNLMLFR
ncbi:MAG: gliding motility-associated C-terminal domain-containing protein [Omnitrophica WOR_2 bacterium]|jgi:gliding motility-associated-like protein